MLSYIRRHRFFGFALVLLTASGIILGGGEFARMAAGMIDPAAKKTCFTKDMAFAEDNNSSPLTKEEQTIFSQNQIVFYEPCTEEGANSNSSTLSGTVSISGTTAEEKVWSGLASFLTPEQAAGVMGNMVGESALNPGKHQGGYGGSSGFSGSIWDNGGGKGLGLIQWDGGRRPKMANYVKSKDSSLVKYLEDGSSYGGLSGDQFIEKAGHDDSNKIYQAELEYLKQELDKYEQYKGIYNQKTVDDASDYFAINVEACGECKESLKNGEKI